ncbi:hypothetical protein [Tsukamurella sp. USMM236]|uniref:hypothetical protein n=1 Tax=Tsukamurella sp. USMM236 TaxID=3081301 RepID=UPI0030188E3E
MAGALLGAAFLVLAVIAGVESVRGHHIPDPRGNNCKDCVFVNGRLSPGEVGASRPALDFGSSTRWRIDEVEFAGSSETGPGGEKVRVGACPLGPLTFPVPGGEMTITKMCDYDVPAGKEVVYFWQWGKMRWRGVHLTQGQRRGPVVERSITGTYYYRLGANHEVLPAPR